MARPLRLAFEDAVYHITARGNRKENIFSGTQDRRVFLEKVNETFEKYSFICYAYCLMDNHYHIFVKTPLANISQGMHYLNASYTNWFKARHKTVGVLFQGRYKSVLVDEDNYSVTLSAYIHANPLRGGMVNDLKEYRWSSYLDYMGVVKSLERIDTRFVLNQVDDDLVRARRKYEQYVLENITIDNPIKNSYKGVALGSEGFIEDIQEKIRALGNRREIFETKEVSTSTAEEIITQVMNEFKIERSEIFNKRRGNMYRQLALYLLKKYTGLSLQEIGDMFDMDYAAVSQACKRYQEKIKAGRGELMMNVET